MCICSIPDGLGISTVHYIGAWKLPPMFPDVLGDYARPFFGMERQTTSLVLFNMFSALIMFCKLRLCRHAVFGLCASVRSLMVSAFLLFLIQVHGNSHLCSRTCWETTHVPSLEWRAGLLSFCYPRKRCRRDAEDEMESILTDWFSSQTTRFAISVV